MADADYVSQLRAEKDNIDPSFVHASRLMAEEIDKNERGLKYTEVHNDKRIKLQEKIRIPNKEHPKFNFVGKLLGPGGATLKQLQQETGTKMSVLGRNSMKDKRKEEELRKSGDAKYAHLNEDLHVLVEVFAPAPEAHVRMGGALTELKNYLIPSEEEMHQQQVMMMQHGEENGRGRGRGGMTRGRGRGRGLMASEDEMHQQQVMMMQHGDESGRVRGRGGMTRGRGRARVLMATPEYEEDPRQQMQGMRYGHHLNGEEAGRGHPRGRGRGAAPGRGRGAATPLLATPPGRGALAPRGGGPPGRGARGAARGAPPSRGSYARPPPGGAKPEPLMDRSGGYGYEEEYSYGHGGYEQETYGYSDPAYDQGYAAPAADTQYFDYGHGDGAGREAAYEDYGEAWPQTSPAYGKAPLGRAKPEYRSHPYGAGRGQPRY